ncbi:MAG TPA: hypothetical protein ACQGQI_08275 [Xylella sp.]
MRFSVVFVWSEQRSQVMGEMMICIDDAAGRVKPATGIVSVMVYPAQWLYDASLADVDYCVRCLMIAVMIDLAFLTHIVAALA